SRRTSVCINYLLVQCAYAVIRTKDYLFLINWYYQIESIAVIKITSLTMHINCLFIFTRSVIVFELYNANLYNTEFRSKSKNTYVPKIIEEIDINKILKHFRLQIPYKHEMSNVMI